MLKPANLRIHAIRGILGFISLFMLFESIRLLPLSEAVTISFLSAIFATLIALFFLKETCSGLQWILIITGFVGVVLIAQPSTSNLKSGILFGLASAFIEGAILIHTRHLGQTINPLNLTFYYSVFASLSSCSVALPNWQTMPLVDWISLIFVGIGGGIGQLAIFQASKYVPGNKIAPLIYTQIVWSLLFDTLFFQASIDFMAKIGMGLIVISGFSSTFLQKIK